MASNQNVPNQNLSGLFKESQLLAALEHLIVAEFERSGSPWVSSHRLGELFSKTHGLELEGLVERCGYGKDLRSFLANSRRFSIYGGPRPHAYHIAMLRVIVPGSLSSGKPAPKLRR